MTTPDDSTASTKPEIHGLILAGGRSQRMGRDKAMLDFGGRSLLAHAVATLQAAGVTQVLVSGDRPGFNSQPDRIPGQGPLGGLFSVQPDPQADALLVLPVDMPWLDAALLQCLMAGADGQHCLRFQGYMLPFVLPLRDPRFAALREDWWAGRWQGRRSLDALQQTLNVQELAVSSDINRRLVNVNTPEDWREASA